MLEYSDYNCDCAPDVKPDDKPNGKENDKEESSQPQICEGPTVFLVGQQPNDGTTASYPEPHEDNGTGEV